ncbi:MAG: ATP-grasp domain-containing protein [Candidatus Bathycorpusculaceae bacterium]
MKTEIKNLLVVGVDTVALASSAKRAGYTVYAADYFGDVDLQKICSKCMAVIKQEKRKSCGRITSSFKPEAFLKIAKILSKNHNIDAVLLSSGLDDHFNILYELNNIIPILGNSPSVIQNVREKPKFFAKLKQLKVPHPETVVIIKDFLEAKEAADKIGYPVVVKPVKGFGGANIILVQNPSELQKAFSKVSLLGESVLIQKFIKGVPASISLLATDKNVTILSANEQLLGLSSVFQQEPFGYCGNIVPLHVNHSTFEKCKVIAEKIALHFGLKGSNGIDIIISNDGTPYVTEVNPRFQGTLECIEKVLGINMVESHINACLHNVLPKVKDAASNFCTRLILYAPKRVLVPNLTVLQEVRDIPLPESIIERGEPLCSILTMGRTRNSSLRKAEKLAKTIYDRLREA